MRRQRRHSRGGFTIAVGVVLMGIAALMFLGLALLMTAQVKRTRTVEVGAQQRQLLLAGTQAVLTQLESGKAPPSGEMTVALPKELDGATLTYTARPGATGDDVTVDIRASVRGSVSRQTVHVSKSGGRWQVREAVLAAGS